MLLYSPRAPNECGGVTDTNSGCSGTSESPIAQSVRPIGQTIGMITRDQSLKGLHTVLSGETNLPSQFLLVQNNGTKTELSEKLLFLRLLSSFSQAIGDCWDHPRKCSGQATCVRPVARFKAAIKDRPIGHRLRSSPIMVCQPSNARVGSRAGQVVQIRTLTNLLPSLHRCAFLPRTIVLDGYMWKYIAAPNRILIGRSAGQLTLAAYYQLPIWKRVGGGNT